MMNNKLSCKCYHSQVYRVCTNIYCCKPKVQCTDCCWKDHVQHYQDVITLGDWESKIKQDQTSEQYHQIDVNQLNHFIQKISKICIEETKKCLEGYFNQLQYQYQNRNIGEQRKLIELVNQNNHTTSTIEQILNNQNKIDNQIIGYIYLLQDCMEKLWNKSKALDNLIKDIEQKRIQLRNRNIKISEVTPQSKILQNQSLVKLPRIKSSRSNTEQGFLDDRGAQRQQQGLNNKDRSGSNNVKYFN